MPTGSTTSRFNLGTFTVDLASVRSDSDQRDSQFRDRIMNTDQFPDATFAPTAPVGLGSVPAVGAQVSARATGDLTIHGETKSITIDRTAQRTAGGLRVNGTIPVTFADYRIDAPNSGGVTVEDDGTSRAPAARQWSTSSASTSAA